MTDGDRRELMAIFNRVLDERFAELRTEIAEGFVVAADGMLADLAEILTQRNDNIATVLEDKIRRANRSEDAARRPIGFTK